MKKLINYLNADIWRKIFQYDNTYHEIYELLIVELILKTRFWRLKWLNKNMDYGLINNKISNSDYKSTEKSIKELVDYWNYKFYPKYLSQSNNKKGNNCEKEYISDNQKNNNFILKNINMLKKYKPKENKLNNKDINYILYKPAKIL